MYGYGGRILTVDVGTGAQRVEELDPTFARSYLGGNGFAAKLCFDRIPIGIDAFDPRNMVAVCTGPVTDSPIPGNSRGCMGGKSPLNGLFFDSTYGGRFPGAQRHTGFDAVVLVGAAAEPVYVVVEESGATLKSAKDLWGKRTLETARASGQVSPGEYESIKAALLRLDRAQRDLAELEARRKATGAKRPQ